MVGSSKDWRPNLGGWLAMLNCAGWLTIIAVDSLAGHRQESPYTECGIVLAFGLSVPFASFLFFPSPGTPSPTVESVAFGAALIGLNSFAWEYCFAAILRWMARSGQSSSS